MSRARNERLAIPASLAELAVASDISMSLLSYYERGLKRLSPEFEERRRAALARLAAQTEAVT